jgi:Tfp pilus assembly pilus retraction ATPase PilT
LSTPDALAPERYTDWYVPDREPQLGVVFPGPAQIPKALVSFAQALRDEARAKTDPDFSMVVHGIRFRGHRQTTWQGTEYVLRRQPQEVMAFKEVGIAPQLATLLLSPELNDGGLVIICGEPGHGKTTTCAATIKERLERYGGVCNTLENPIEQPLSGWYGEEGGPRGICRQVETTDFAQGIKNSLRCFPADPRRSILLVGEVRDGETAAQTLWAANAGHLVFTTMHGSDILSALQRLASLSSERSLSSREARALLADSMRLVIHQTLQVDDRAGERRNPTFHALWSGNRSSKLAGYIRNPENAMTALKTELTRQETLFRQNRPISE